MELRQTKTKDMGNFTYECTQLGAIRGSQVFVRVLKLLGPAFASKDPGALFAALQEEDLKYFIDAFSPMTMVMGVGQLDKVFDTHFVGRYMDMMKLLFFHVEINFGDFLGKGQSLGAALGATKGPSASNSQTVIG